MIRAVLFDAMGTLVWLEPPAPRLAAATGVDEDTAAQALADEIAYYRRHAHEGADPASLEDLRRRCAALLSDRLGVEVDVEMLLRTLRFRPFDDAGPALDELAGRGIQTAVVSNWDCSLPDALADAGLADRLDAVVTSSQVGAPKPDPAAFEAALAAVGVGAEQAVHVGDDLGEDVGGARAAGIRPIHLDRDEHAGDVASLDELAGVL